MKFSVFCMQPVGIGNGRFQANAGVTLRLLRDKHMEFKTCCVTGHRNIPMEKQETVEARLRREVSLASLGREIRVIEI
ncbi:hypothetical protein RWV98_18625 [Agathobaculum sp. NTUH-O15-33]|uniref:hypothetical protein n=1 Tax=Agathobaculum sp. NTUH-O15-33 TaxID=3079302 RepID=UPI002958AC94|nr:hypothetical protein [Agathobaculum sp. NTUH-O15-33]WNX84564.1 hypothetical protein RWV98_18625 [Agathobaculum sp. NTUH-O15-33]